MSEIERQEVAAWIAASLDKRWAAGGPIEAYEGAYADFLGRSTFGVGMGFMMAVEGNGYTMKPTASGYALTPNGSPRLTP